MQLPRWQWHLRPGRLRRGHGGMAVTLDGLAGQLCHLGIKSGELSPGVGSATAEQRRRDALLLSRGHREWAGTLRFTPAFTGPVKSNSLFRHGYG